MSAISKVLKSQASSITGNAIDAALSVGKAALNAVMPDDIEYYLCSLELYNQDKKRVGFLSFVVMPDQMEENHSPIQTMIKTHRGIATVLNDSFAPVDISFSGTFGRKWRLLSSFKDPKLELDTKGFLNLSFGSVAGIGVGLKSGYGITKIMDVDPLLGITAGSVSMTGGHGTAGGFAGVLEGMGLKGADSIGMAAATFGLIAGSMLGGPLADLIIRKRLKDEQRQPQDEAIDPAMAGIESDEASPEGREKHVSTNELEFQQYAKASYWILLVMGGGTVLRWLLAKTGVAFPQYFGALILAAIVRNVMGVFRYRKDGQWVKAEGLLDMERIISVGNICLSLFLGMAMISLKLWELQSLALPLIIILVAQVLLMGLFAYFVAFPMLGSNYDAAVLCAGLCGFGLGATPNAMANMSAICYKYHYSAKPFIIVPIIGSMFTDLINTGIITFFLSLF